MRVYLNNDCIYYLSKKCFVCYIPNVFVRVVSVSEKTVERKPKMRQVFGEKSIPYRQKVIFVFQEQKDGREVCLFGMQTHEYADGGNPSKNPNSRRVYLAYVDSEIFCTAHTQNHILPQTVKFIFRPLSNSWVPICPPLGLPAK